MQSGGTVAKAHVSYTPCEGGTDATEPREELSHKTQHVSFLWVLMSGAGFLADAYDLFVINIAVDIMARCPYKQPLTMATISTVKSMAVGGAIIGQILFGTLADIIGRKQIFIATCYLVMLGCILSGLAVDSQVFGIYSQVALWRFLLGVGIGGEYPLSAAITAESSHSGAEIRNLAMVFGMQGLGTLLCSLVLVAMTRCLGDNYDLQWRLALLIGALPMAGAFVLRWRAEKKTQQASNKPGAVTASHGAQKGLLGVLRFGVYNSLRIVHYNFWPLLGTAGAWCLLDVVFYANGLFSGQVTDAMGYAHSPRSEASASLLLQSISLPGYLCAALFADRIGLRRLQLCGFAATTAIFLALSMLQPYLSQSPPAYVALYGLTFFAQNFGPNTTTYIIPSLLFPPEHRGTCHGISAAAGKVGALFAAQVFLYLVDCFCPGGRCTAASPQRDVSAGLRLTFLVCGLVGVLGWLWTWYLVPEPQLGQAHTIHTLDYTEHGIYLHHHGSEPAGAAVGQAEEEGDSCWRSVPTTDAETATADTEQGGMQSKADSHPYTYPLDEEVRGVTNPMLPMDHSSHSV